MYRIAYAESVSRDLAAVRSHDRKRVLDSIEEQLTHEPTRPSRRRKVIVGLVPPWEHAPPIWQLRVGSYRVFYDVDEGATAVTIRAIRYKPPHKTTEEIL
jgi:mRNA-degrading endonuclease RelE of RelBE toxin-antitoxin system